MCLGAFFGRKYEKVVVELLSVIEKNDNVGQAAVPVMGTWCCERSSAMSYATVGYGVRESFVRLEC